MMKQIFPAIATCLLLGACSHAGNAAPPDFADMKQCDDLSCLADAAETCTPAVATFLNDVFSGTNSTVYVDYRLGIRGWSGKNCMAYHKLLSVRRTLDDVSVPGTDNYASCMVDDTAEFSAYLHGNRVLSDLLLMQPSEFDGASCDWMAVPGPEYPSVEYMLARGQWVADMDESFSVVVRKLDFEKSVTLEIQKGEQAEEITLVPGEKKSALGYGFMLKEFGQTNLAWKTGGEDFREAVTIVVSF